MDHLLEWEDFLNESNEVKYKKLYQDYKSSIGSKEQIVAVKKIQQIASDFYKEKIDQDRTNDGAISSLKNITPDKLLKKGLEIIKDTIGDVDDVELTDKVKWMRKIEIPSLMKKYNIDDNMKQYTFQNLPSDIKNKMSKS